ncbi:polysaccharide biosynthesis protein [Streptomyces sp. NPDC004065]|uniref:polysaccharide biosynthesis protein n=1 Tax=Streptomyces sp. NPDC004065 TaxID=3364689 RepID=UPI00384C0358
MELHGHGLLDDERIVLGDLRDRRAMDALMARVRPHVVFHAAAHKHLPLLERYPVEGLRTNVLGTVNVRARSLSALTAHSASPTASDQDRLIPGVPRGSPVI